ncbi:MULTISPECIES: glycosyltransferase [Crocosphaera]|uniref:Glycosyl transferase group 1 n=1 Tax=Crocosphaera watsonii WH 0003 TaxID=423471 RepID=G5J021_CROWT|nr:MULTISPECIES: glycosyltransferase [Crocosphaera]EHJ14469.1 glycosyl transferase group 1 [Crocosphaera watsonii WH 0003]MCH2246321.1 glycosyltransferase [Crocosphaera sp.]NQZ60617.1 glycosyltransferase [Crocosphaera sp.]
MKKINIITVDNNGGLTRDAKILKKILQESGFKVSVFEVGKPTIGHKLHRIYTYGELFFSEKITKTPPYDINLFLQDIIPAWFSYAKINCLIPNQEWFRDGCLQFLPKLDYILCKTKYAQSIFKKLGCQTEFISFSSFDCWDQHQEKNYNQFFHLAGSSSIQKGTKTIVTLWNRHPEWPTLILRQNKKSFHVSAPNIQYIHDFLDDETLKKYQNTLGIHLCPSEAEGFGHYILEAMSTKALTLTTNAPPMNELITPERGLLVNYHNTKPQRLGTNYYVDPQNLEEKIEEVLAMSHQQRKEIAENARHWYLENEQFFRQKLVTFLQDL